MSAAAIEAIRSRAPGLAPEVGIVLGSGLGDFEKRIEGSVAISYADIPGFPETEVAGHFGRLVLGRIGDAKVAVMSGRAHYFESGRADAMKAPIRALAGLGCDTMILTNAAGSLRPESGPGSVVLITDHINLVGQSPLFGETGSDRFVDMTDAYDPEIRAAFHRAAKAEGLALGEGVYMWFAGPQFETPAEIRVAAKLGADLVGMSTVPEVILARHAGLKVGALSIVTNMAAGLAPNAINHRQTLEGAAAAADSVGRLLTRFLNRRAKAP